jgi:peroxiredoxin
MLTHEVTSICCTHAREYNNDVKREQHLEMLLLSRYVFGATSEITRIDLGRPAKMLRI